MGQFSISQLSQFSGIKPHTIRIWEQRYKALRPYRSEGNTRYYDNHQLRRLLNIVSLTGSGFKISQLGTMKDAELFRLISEIEKKRRGSQLNEFYVSQLIAAGMEFNQLQFGKTFSKCIKELGMRGTYLQVIYPMLDRIGLMWAANNIPPAQEHFISNILQQKLYTAIDNLPAREETEETWLLFLPENEFHEIGLLFANYLIKQSGRKVIYLGANLPFSSLTEAVKETCPSKMLLFFVHYDLPENSREYLKNLEEKFPEQEIYLSGNRRLLSKIEPGSIHLLQSVGQLEEELELQRSLVKK